MVDQPNIVLAHGAWADGSSWSAVIERLQAAGYRVTALQFSLAKLAEDVARLRRVLARQDGADGPRGAFIRGSDHHGAW
jgi:pimeloyl-ACP methyl ester carboxylesterase